MTAAILRASSTDTLKWVASGAQILGYGATAMGLTP